MVTALMLIRINKEIVIIKTACQYMKSDGRLNIVTGELIGNLSKCYME
jgi:hypothetical protein